MNESVAQVFQFPPKKNGIGAAEPTLSVGSSGQAVRDVQGLLQILDYDVNADSIFGPQTEAAVRKFQQDAGLTVDGIVGKQTYDALVAKAKLVRFDDPNSSTSAEQGVTYNPVSRPGVTQGGAAADQSNLPVQMPQIAGRPLWQWGLIAVGVVGGLYLLAKHLDGQLSGVSHRGYSRFLSDGEPASKAERIVGSGSTKKCGRTPSHSKLSTAETMEAA